MISVYSEVMPTSSSGLVAGQSKPGASTRGPDLFPFRGLFQHLLPIERIRDLYRRAQQPVNRSLLENVLTEMGVEYSVSDSDLARIPASGPVVVTSNHPFGILDGAILGALLGRVRPDVQVMTNSLLAGIPELREHCIFVDPFGNPESVPANRQALRRAIFWLRTGGMLAVFPSGEVSHLQLPQMEVSDPRWNATAVRLVRLTGAAAIPLFFHGRNSVPFQAMGLIHPKLRTAWLLNEFLQQKDRKVNVHVGSPVSAEFLQRIGSDHDAVNYLRWRTYLLAQRGSRNWQPPPALKAVWPTRRQEPIAEGTPQSLLLEDLAALSPLEQNREFAAYLADAGAIPNLLQEVGRLREVTFRETGEGTGRRRDLDRFDRYYKHLLLWSKRNQELVGAYRLGLAHQILPCHGIPGLYTSTLFRYTPGLFDRLGPALELGRSFVRPEYQRQYGPLLMLWKGIGRFLVQNPELATLFGAVSISSRYNRASRELMFRFFQAQPDQEGIARMVTPRHPFRPRWRPRERQAACEGLSDLQELPISDLESDGKGLPILLKQYAKLGGRILAFNVDRQFSNVLDGLVLVDLRRTSATVLERYMGRDGAEAFRRYHGISCRLTRE
jgi:putative hemolysin